MAERVNKLPSGLREDANLDNGIFVGSLHTRLNFACAPVQKDEQIVLGSCSDQPPKSAYIDDKEGVVYIPAGQDVYLKLDEEDGIEKEFGFGKRLSMWWEGFTDEYIQSPPLKYLFGGSDRVSFKEVKETESWGMSSDFYAYVLDHASEAKFQKDPKSVLTAARFWFGAESAYKTLAKQKLLELADNSQVEGRIRLEAAGALGDQALLELAKDQTLAAYYRVEACKEIKADYSEQVIDSLLEIFNDPTADGGARAEAVERVRWAIDNISQQKNSPDRIPQVIGNLVAGLQNWQGDPETRYKVANSFGWPSDQATQLFNIFYQIATNPKAGAGDRVYAWKYVLESTEGKAKINEALRELLRLAQDQTVEAPYRYEAGGALLSGHRAAEPYRKEAFMALLGLLKDSTVDAKLRWHLGASLYWKSQQSSRDIQLQEVLAGFAELLKKEEMGETRRLEVAKDIFLEGEKPEVLAKAIDFYLERKKDEPMKAMHLFAESKLSREAALLRLGLIEQRLSWHDLFDRIWVALETRRLASPEAAPVAKKNRKLIVQIEK